MTGTTPLPARYEPRPHGDGFVVFDTFSQEPVADTDTSPSLPQRPISKLAAIRAAARLNRAYQMAIE